MADVDLDLAQVRAFVAVVDHGQVSRAGASLFLTQQALSKRIARLETAVGTLFDRGPAGLALNERGRRFLPVARQLIDVADAALAAARAEPPPPLRVDVWGHLHEPLAVVRAFADSHPDTVVELSMRRSLPQAVAALERHELDLAVGNLANFDGPLPARLESSLVTVERLVALVHEQSELASVDAVTPAHLRRAGLWWPAAASSPELAGFVAEYARAVGAPLSTEGSNMGIDVLIQRVAGDPGVVTLVGGGWPIPAGGGVRLVPIRPVPCYPWYAIWRIDSPHPRLPSLLRHLHEAGGVRDLDPGASWLPASVRPAGLR